MSSTENKMQNTNWREGYTAGYTAGAKAERERVMGILEVYRPRGCDCRNCAEMDDIRRRVEEGH